MGGFCFLFSSECAGAGERAKAGEWCHWSFGGGCGRFGGYHLSFGRCCGDLECHHGDLGGCDGDLECSDCGLGRDHGSLK